LAGGFTSWSFLSASFNRIRMKTTTPPTPSWLPQRAENLLPLLVMESDAQKLLAIGRADVKMLAAEGRLKSVAMPDGTRRITLQSIAKYYSELTGESIIAPMTGRTREAEAPSP
jgi:hypothetical protein